MTENSAFTILGGRGASVGLTECYVEEDTVETGMGPNSSGDGGSGFGGTDSDGGDTPQPVRECDRPGDYSPGGRCADLRYQQVVNGQPATPASPADPPPDPETLYRSVLATLTLPEPKIKIGPDLNTSPSPTHLDPIAAVKVPINLWVDNDTTLTATDTDQTLTVTVTAKLTSIDLEMGEPAANSREIFQLGPPVTLHCDNPGNPPPANPGNPPPPNPNATDTDCTYTYHWRSLKSRTNGTGRWTINTTATWEITWTSTTGTHNTTPQTITQQSTTQIEVGEYIGVLIPSG